jgi:hypothetical protein
MQSTRTLPKPLFGNVTRLKDNAVYEARREYDIPDNADSRILKDERIILKYGKNKEFADSSSKCNSY